MAALLLPTALLQAARTRLATRRGTALVQAAAAAERHKAGETWLAERARGNSPAMFVITTASTPTRDPT